MFRLIFRRAVQVLALLAVAAFMIVDNIAVVGASIAALLVCVLLWRRFFNDGQTGYWPGKPIE